MEQSIAAKALAESLNPPKEKSKDFIELENGVKALVLIHQLLNEGTFQGYRSADLSNSLNFIASLHSQSLTKLKEHPEFEEPKENKVAA